MPYILLGDNAYKRYAEALHIFGFTPISLPHSRSLNKTVSDHADTLIFSGGSVHIINASYAEALPDEVRRRLTEVSEYPRGDYPSDTAFNALRIGHSIFAGGSVAACIRNYAAESGLNLVRVKQGYARCSTLPLSGSRAAITADEGMAKAMESAGITVLRIAPGHIALTGCEYGFIGGASFVWEQACCCSLSEHKRDVFFFGDIKRHPDGTRITEFISRFGYNTVCLPGELTDFGGAVIVE